MSDKKENADRPEVEIKSVEEVEREFNKMFAEIGVTPTIFTVIRPGDLGSKMPAEEISEEIAFIETDDAYLPLPEYEEEPKKTPTDEKVIRWFSKLLSLPFRVPYYIVRNALLSLLPFTGVLWLCSCIGFIFSWRFGPVGVLVWAIIASIALPLYISAKESIKKSVKDKR